jgi:hypothetical protein
MCERLFVLIGINEVGRPIVADKVSLRKLGLLLSRAESLLREKRERALVSVAEKLAREMRLELYSRAGGKHSASAGKLTDLANAIDWGVAGRAVVGIRGGPGQEGLVDIATQLEFANDGSDAIFSTVATTCAEEVAVALAACCVSVLRGDCDEWDVEP